VYVASPQLSWLGSGSAWAVRASGSIALADAIRRAVADIDPRERIGPMQSMSDVISGTTAAPKFNASLSGGFALIALALTAIGVYGVLAFSVARRVGEIGLRMALGASPASVIGLVLREGMTLMIVGLAIGLGGAYWLSRTLTSLLFGVTDSDVVSFVGVSVLLVLVGLAASAIPAGRASRIDPLEALRME
jgi:putative ABC transport system permease protein